MTDTEFETMRNEVLDALIKTHGSFHIPTFMNELRMRLSNEDYALAEEHIVAAWLTWRGMQLLGLEP